MSAIFISHSSQDDACAENLRAWLRQKGYAAIFLDFDPEDGIAVGRNWERELYAQLDASIAVVVLCSRASMASKWCFHEVASARARRIPLFPVRIDDCQPLDLLRDLQIIDLFPNREEALDRLWRSMLAQDVDPTKIFPWDREQYRERGPYPGLTTFTRDDAGVYFGREGAIREVRAELDRQSRQGASRAVLILGASGSGKSSLMRAGVLPRLERDTDRWIPLEPFEPQGVLGPLPRLAQVLAAACNTAGLEADFKTLNAELGRAAGHQPPDPAALTGLLEMLRLTQGSADAAVVMALDQVEQILGAESGPQGEAFLALLRAALEQRGSPLVLLATLRSDCLGAWQGHPLLQGLSFGSVTLGPMAAEGFRQIIELPARVHALELETGLSDAIITDIGSNPDSLPLLAFTLHELYRGYGRDDHRLGVGDYRDRLGGVASAIERKAEEVYQQGELSSAQQESLRLFFVGLAQPTEEGSYVRRRVPWTEVESAIETLVERYVASGLLVSDRRPLDAGTDTAVEERVLTVAHEALFRAWPRLQEWLADARESHAAAERCRGAMRRWQEAGCPPDDLLLRPGRELEAARELLGVVTVPIDDLRSYIETSITAEEERRREAERQRQRERDAQAEAGRQRLDRLGTQSRLEVENGDVTLGLLLALEGAQDADAAPASASRIEAALLRAVFTLRERRILSGAGPLNQAIFSPDGALILTLGRNASARLWDTATGALRHTLESHGGQLLKGAFAADGRCAATTSSDGTATLHEVETGAILGVLTGHVEAIHDVAFSPQSRSVVTASADGTARVFEVATARPQTALIGHEGAIYCVVFSPDGTRVLTASADQTARLWDSRTGICLACFEGHEAPIYRVVFSHDGRSLASASWDATARLWDAATFGCRAVLRGHSGGVEPIEFSPDDRMLLTASADTTVRVWSTVDGEPIATLIGHEGQVFDAGFSPDGRRIASAADDGTLRLWEASSGSPVVTLSGHAGTVWRRDFSADGRTLVSAGEDGTARVWDMSVGDPAAILAGHEGEVYGAIFSPDGKHIATASEDWTARLWNAVSGQLRAILEGHTRPIWELAYAASGELIATASEDGTARLWDPSSGTCVQTLRGHEGWVGHVAFAPDGRRVATCGEDRSAVIWDVDNGHETARCVGHDALIRQVFFTPDGARVVTLSDDGTARLWDAASGASQAVLDDQGGAVVSASISADGQSIATASLDGTVAVYEGSTGKRHLLLEGHRNQVWHVAFADDGQRLVSAAHDNRAMIWEVATGRLLSTLAGHRGRVIGAVFSPGGRLVLTASWDRTARLWHAATGQLVATLGGHGGALHSAVFAPDGWRVLTAAADRTARVFALPVGPEEDWVAHARRIAPRSLSDEERRLYT